MADKALAVLSPDFEILYSRIGRPSIPPEKLLQAFYTIHPEWRLMWQPDCSLRFRWFVGLAMDAPVRDDAVFGRNRDRLLPGDVATKFLAAVVAQAKSRDLLSHDNLSDRHLVEAGKSPTSSFRTTW